MESGNELVELLWQNGQVVFHSQAHKNPRPTPNESRKVQNPVQSILSGGKPCGNLNCSAQGDETASWIQCPLEDSLEELCSEFFFEVPSSDPIEVTGQMKQFEEGKCIQSGASKATTVFSNSTALGSQTPIAKQSNNPNFTENQMPLHQSINPDALQRNFCLGKAKRSENFCNFTRPLQAELVSADGSAGETVLSNTIRSEVAESSMMTLGSSHCRSNQGPTETDFSWVSSNRVGANEFLGRPIADDVQKMFPPCEREQTDSLEPNLTSSSGGSGGTSGKTWKDSNAINRNKRKGRNKDESEPETGSDEASGSAQRSGSARRRRAAEVHNLSERRRRDRINEKMKALQELIPHCNKTDKASMLDEAIEYLKSLQLQVQIMWIRSGMASATFPSVQHYISQMGIGMGMAPSSIPSIHNPLHFPRVQLLDQAMSMAPASNHPAICSNSISNPVNFQTQMQSTNFFKPYAHCMGFHHMQTAPQPMNRFNFGSQTIQETATLPTSSNGHCSRGTPTSDPTSKMG